MKVPCATNFTCGIGSNPPVCCARSTSIQCESKDDCLANFGGPDASGPVSALSVVECDDEGDCTPPETCRLVSGGITDKGCPRNLFDYEHVACSSDASRPKICTSDATCGSKERCLRVKIGAVGERGMCKE